MELQMKRNDPQKAYEFFLNKMSFTTGPAELKHFIDNGKAPTIIDVRAAEDFAKGHIPGAINLPENKWSTLEGLSKDGVNIVYCYSVVCHLAARACVSFAQSGCSVMEMDGGWAAWEEFEYPVERAEKSSLGTKTDQGPHRVNRSDLPKGQDLNRQPELQ